MLWFDFRFCNRNLTNPTFFRRLKFKKSTRFSRIIFMNIQTWLTRLKIQFNRQTKVSSVKIEAFNLIRVDNMLIVALFAMLIRKVLAHLSKKQVYHRNHFLSESTPPPSAVLSYKRSINKDEAKWKGVMTHLLTREWNWRSVMQLHIEPNCTLFHSFW